MTVRGYLHQNKIHTKFNILPVVLYENTREKGWGWFLLDKKTTSTGDTQLVVVTAIFEDEV